MDNESATVNEPLHATRNACKVCAPLGAAMVFKGVRNCLPFLHGSQGCATYIRRYMISHFREPVDIASSSFTEQDAIFGGSRNFKAGVDNAISQYAPEVIGVATTCLSETIGENMIAMIRDCQKDAEISSRTPLVHVSTPAYSGSHSEGFHAAVKAMVKHFAKADAAAFEVPTVNIMPGMVSCADLRHLRELAGLFGMNAVMLPDYSDTLEGESWDTYHRISPGGTPISDIASMGKALGSVELGHMLTVSESAGAWLDKSFNVPNFPLGLSIGLRSNDKLMAALAAISGNPTPDCLLAERGRLLDSYVDAHKYLAGVKVAVVGDPDMVLAVAGFLSEIGARPVICACGTKPRAWKDFFASEIVGGVEDVRILPGTDHHKLDAAVREAMPDLVIGTSKAAPLARSLKIPLVRIGFPIHDRFGAQRQLCVGYKGTQALFDSIVNALLEHRQESNPIGYSYL
ncbi:MAG: nitrogenase component 1 [Opitutales bacterium]|jgi:nitrogenase molybdenum-iron protein NifN